MLGDKITTVSYKGLGFESVYNSAVLDAMCQAPNQASAAW